MTMIEAAAIAGAYVNDPTKTRNSPTKPESPGSPAEARMKKPKTVDHSGITAARPPIFAIDRSWVRS